MTDSYLPPPAGHSFEAELESSGRPGSWTIARIPEQVSATLGGGARTAVKGTINGAPFRSNAMPFGDGGFFLVVNKDARTAAGVGPGDKVTITLEPDDPARDFEPPAVLADALASSPETAAAWDAMSYSAKKEYADWIAGAKADDTRQRRLAKALEGIAARKRLSAIR